MRHTGPDGGDHPPTLAEVSSNLQAGVGFRVTWQHLVAER